jgi:hypothetical protein
MTTTSQQPSGHLTLDSVKQAFDHWRSHKGNDNKIPDSLWQQVIQLVPHYRQRRILNTLHLNHAQLRRRLHSVPQMPEAYPPVQSTPTPQLPSPFIKAFLPSTAEQHTYQVEWQRPDGARLTVNNLDSPGLTTLIQQWRA